MKEKIGVFITLLPTFCFAASYWGCFPQETPKEDPKVMIVKSHDGSAFFRFEEDLVRDQGRLPAGDYHGELSPSSSGYSLFAKLNVSKYFPYSQTSTWLSIALSTKSKVFLAEAYLLWIKEDGSMEGMILNSYGCWGKGPSF